MHRLIEISPPDILDMEWKRGLDLFMHGGSAMSYVWTMRAARFEYDIHSAVKRKVRYLPHPAGPGGTNLSPMGGFLLAVPANLPDHRARRAHEAIASMASPDAMRVHAKNGFPVVPRFSVAADPEAAAGLAPDRGRRQPRQAQPDLHVAAAPRAAICADRKCAGPGRCSTRMRALRRRMQRRRRDCVRLVGAGCTCPGAALAPRMTERNVRSRSMEHRWLSVRSASGPTWRPTHGSASAASPAGRMMWSRTSTK